MDMKSLHGLDIDNGCMPFRRRADGSVDMIAMVSAATLKKLKAKRAVTIELLDDGEDEARRSAAEVSRTNRYADGSMPVPLGIEGLRHVD
jgi:hypothetical protein